MSVQGQRPVEKTVARGAWRMLVIAALSSGAATVLVGCGTGDLVGSCISVNAADHTCTEVHGAVKAADVDAVGAEICGLDQVWSKEFCVLGTTLGACRYETTSARASGALTLTAYHFPSGRVRTTADVKAICASLHATFVAP